jgi:hypothetical protein
MGLRALAAVAGGGAAGFAFFAALAVADTSAPTPVGSAVVEEGAPAGEATPDVASPAPPTAMDATDPDAAPAAPEVADPDAALTAREIYSRVLDNRFDSSVQEYVLISTDRASNTQELRIRQMWKRYPEGTKSWEKGVLSRTVLRYLEPSDLRQTAYLIINNRDQPNDQFVYLKSQRRTRRLNLRNETIAGTDLSIEDLVPRELDDAEYTRAPDTEIDGTPCFVVEATPHAEMESNYSRFLLYVEKEHYVPIRIRYWDRKEVEIKEMRSPPASIRLIEHVWVPITATMRHLLEKTQTSMNIDVLVPNPVLPDRFFTERQLHSKRMRLPDDVMEKAQKL